MALVGILINFSTAAMILHVTTPAMQSYSRILFFYQISSALFELFLHLAGQEWFIPPTCIKFHGLLGYLGPRVLGIIGTSLLLMTVIGIAACFIYRHRQILTAGHRLRVSPWLWLIFLLFEYLLWVGGLSAVIYPAVFTQDLSVPRMQLLLQVYPNWRFLLDVPDLWLMDGSAEMAFLPFTSLIGFVFVSLLTSVNFVAGAGVLIGHSVYLLNYGLGHMSQATRHMHRKLIVNMFLQLLVPLLTLTIPWAAGVLIVYLDVELPLVVPKILFLVNGCHGIMSSVQIVYLTRPYRQFVISFFTPKNTRRAHGIFYVAQISTTNPRSTKETHGL